MTKLKRWYAYAPPLNGLLMTSSLSLATVWYARFYHAEPAPVVGTTKCPGSLCLMLALPSPGKRAPFPARTLLLGHCSYRPIRQTYWALLSFSYSPRQGVFAGCYQPLLPPGSSRRYSVNLSSDA